MLLERALQVGDALSSRDRLDTLLTLCSLSRQMATRYAKDYLELYSLPELERPEPSHVLLLQNFVSWAIESRTKAIADLAVNVLSRKPVGFDALAEEQQQSWEAIHRFAQSLRDLSFSPGHSEIAAARGTLDFIAKIKYIAFTTFQTDYARLMQMRLATLLRKVAPNEMRRGQRIGRNDLVWVSYDGESRRGKYKKFQDDLEAGRCVLMPRPTGSD